MPITSFGPSQTFPRFQSLVYPSVTPTTLAAGNQTLTAAQVLNGLLISSTTGSTDTLTLPTATLLAAAVPGVAVNVAFEFLIKNNDPADTITIAAGTGGTANGTMTIAAGSIKRFMVVFTAVQSQGVVGSSNAYTLYSLGTSVA